MAGGKSRPGTEPRPGVQHASANAGFYSRSPSEPQLIAELRHAAEDVRQPHLDRLRGLGVSIGWMADAETYPFGVAHCEPSGPGLYQPNPGAAPLHMILPVIEDAALVDLIAFRSSDPGNWMLRTGIGWALGLARGVGHWMWSERVHLFDTPLDWLRGRGDGICVLDWDAPEVRDLDVLPEVVCSSPAVAKAFERALTRPVHCPKISIMEARNAA